MILAVAIGTLTGLVAGFLLAVVGAKTVIRNLFLAALDAGQSSRADAKAFLGSLKADARTPPFLRRHIERVLAS